MSMDLVPRNKNAKQFHVAWSSWSMLIDLVEDLGGDVSDVSGSNDGEYLPAKTLKQWATLLERNAGRLYGITNLDGATRIGVDHDGYRLLMWQSQGLESCPLEAFYAWNAYIAEFIKFCRTSSGCWQH